MRKILLVPKCREKNTENRPRSEHGQSLIEFAFGLVVLLVLLAGAVDGGRALFTYLSLRDAAQEGALYGSIEPDGEIEDRVLAASDLVSNLEGDLDIDIDTGAGCAGALIKVTVTYPNFPLTMPFIGPLIGSSDNTIPISAAVTDMILIPKCDE